MAEMDLAAVMDALAERVGAAVPGLERVYPWPIPSAEPPAFIVGYPAQIDLDATMNRGSDRAVFPCWAVCGNANERSARDVLASFLLGIKHALDGAEAGVWQSARAQAITIEIRAIAEVETLEARFDVDVIT